MPKDKDTADLFEADGVTPKVADKPNPALEALKAAEMRAARAEGVTEGIKTALKTAPAKTPAAEKTFSRQELRSLVNKGEFTEDQMDEILDKQNRTSLLKEVTSTVKASSVQGRIEGQIAEYVASHPDINKEGTALRAKVQQAFDELVEMGDSASALSTELKAIKIAVGPVKSAGAGRRPAPDSHEEVGDGSNDTDKPENGGWAKGLSPAQKTHYEKQINRGFYKGPTDKRLLDEVKIAASRGRAH